MAEEPIITIKDLRVHFFTYEGVVKALDGVSFFVNKGETLGLVGETGCGKSVTVRSIMRLIEEPGRIVGGEILYRDTNILDLKMKEVRKIRGRNITMIFQDPMTFLNPVMKVGVQVAEMLVLHAYSKLDDEEKASISLKDQSIKEEVIKILETVRLPNAEALYDRYPHELSGGMRQRVLIAMAIAARPDVIIADEATTALDVTIQAQILELLDALKRELKTTLIVVTHNLGLIAETCNRVIILYGGQICEIAETKELFANSKHPYTEGLFRAIPLLHKPKVQLEAIPGVVPNLVNPPSGCRFHPRCTLAQDICKQEKPEPNDIGGGHFVACHVRAPILKA
ncbi:MAG: ABC transporter ATP-binding protein [Promethearchaeota archaeon]